jgi:hypothetical protein
VTFVDLACRCRGMMPGGVHCKHMGTIVALDARRQRKAGEPLGYMPCGRVGGVSGGQCRMSISPSQTTVS